MEIATFGVALDPSGVMTGTQQMRQALEVAKSDARAAAEVVGKLHLSGKFVDEDALKLARDSYTEALQREKELTKAIRARQETIGDAQQKVAPPPATGSLDSYDASIKKVQKDLADAQKLAADLLQVKPTGANPALDDQLTKVKVLRQELKVLQDAYNAMKGPPPAPPPAASVESKTGAKDIMRDIAKADAEMAKLFASVQKVEKAHLFGPQAVAESVEGLNKMDDILDIIVSRAAQLDKTGLKNFDVQSVVQKLSQLKTEVLQLKEATDKIASTKAPTLNLPAKTSAASPEGIKTMEKEMQAANEKVKELTAGLALLEAQGQKLSPEQMVEYNNQMDQATAKAKRMAQGIESVTTATKKTHLSAMQLYGFFMGIQSIFGAPLAKAAGLSDATQEVVDKVTEMGMAGFSAGQIISTSFGVAAAGALAVGGAVVALVSQMNDAKIKAEEIRKTWKEARSDQTLKKEDISYEPEIKAVRDYGKALEDLQKAYLQGNSFMANLVGNVSIYQTNLNGQLDALVSGSEAASEALARTVYDANQIVVKEKSTEIKKSYQELKRASDEAEAAYYRQEKAAADAAMSVADYTGRFIELKNVMFSSEDDLPTALVKGKSLVTAWVNDIVKLTGHQKDVTKAAKEYAAAHQELMQKGKGSKEADPYAELIKKLKEARDLQEGLNKIRQPDGDVDRIAAEAKALEAINGLRDKNGNLILKEGDARRKVVKDLTDQIFYTDKLNKSMDAYRKQEKDLGEANDDLEAQIRFLDYEATQLTWVTQSWAEYKKAVKDGTDGVREHVHATNELVTKQAQLKDILAYATMTKELQKQLDYEFRKSETIMISSRNRGTELKYLELISQAEAKNIELTEERRATLHKVAEAQQNVVEATAQKGIWEQQANELNNYNRQYSSMLAMLKSSPGEYERWNKEQEIANQLIAETGSSMGDVMSQYKEYIDTSVELQRQMNRASVKFIADNADLWSSLEGAGVDAINQLNSAWSDWITGGKFDVEELFKSVHKNVTELTLKFLEAQAMAKILANQDFGKVLEKSKVLSLQASKNADAAWGNLRDPDQVATKGAAKLLEEATKVAATNQITAAEITTSVGSAGASAAAAAASATAAAASAALAGQIAAQNAVAQVAGSAADTASSVAGVAAAVQHEGGYTGQSTNYRNVSSSVFRGAGSFAKGGSVRGDEIPIIAHENEAIVPLANGRRIPVVLNGSRTPSTSIINTYNTNVAMGSSLPHMYSELSKQPKGIDTNFKHFEASLVASQLASKRVMEGVSQQMGNISRVASLDNAQSSMMVRGVLEASKMAANTVTTASREQKIAVQASLKNTALSFESARKASIPSASNAAVLAAHTLNKVGPPKPALNRLQEVVEGASSSQKLNLNTVGARSSERDSGPVHVENHWHLPPGSDPKGFMASRSQIDNAISNMVRRHFRGK